MKAHLAITLRILIFLFCTISAFGERLDVILEGPWILFEDDETFKSVHVLVVMAPGGTVHRVPSFSTGDGFNIPPGIHCVAFNGQCFGSSTKSLDKDGYKQPSHLQVHLKDGRKWYDNNSSQINPAKDAVYLILPMPDSYSDDGVDNMEFGSTFGAHGKQEMHSIGTQLHYDSSVNNVNLSGQCTVDATKAPVIQCPNPDSSPLDNTGTLQIIMRAPEEYEYCSYHVRDAYPNMLLLLDDTPLDGSRKPNKNQQIAYIDLPEDGAYSACQDCDPQNLDLLTCDLTPVFQLADVNILAAVNRIISRLESLGIRDDSQDTLRVKALKNEVLTLSEQFPRFFQLQRITKELKESLAGTGELLRKLQAREKAKDQKSTNTTGDINLIIKIQETRLDERTTGAYIARYLNAATSGKDCRAVQMLVTP